MTDEAANAKEPAYLGAAAAIITASILPTITITPILPKMQAYFADMPQVDLLAQLIYALPALLSMLAAPYAGHIGDRLGRREIVIISCICATVLGVVPYFLDSIWLIVFSRAFLGLFQGTLIVCTSALIADYFIKRKRQRVLSLKFGIVGIANIALLVAVGYISINNWRNGFLLYLFGVLPALLVIFYIKVPPHTQLAVRAEKIPLPWKWLLAPYLGAFLGAASFTMLFSQLPFLLQIRGISSSPAFAGNLTSVISVGMLIAAFSYAALVRKISSMTLWCISFGLITLGFTVLSFSPQLSGIIAGGFLSGLGAGTVMPNSLNMVLGRVPAAARGRATGVQTTCFFLGVFAGPMIGVLLSRAFGAPSPALGAWGAVAACACMAYIILSRREAEQSAKNASSV